MSLAALKTPGIPDGVLLQARLANPGLSPAEIEMIAVQQLAAKNKADSLSSGDFRPGNASGTGGSDDSNYYADTVLEAANFSSETIRLETQQSQEFFSGNDGAFKGDALGAQRAAQVSTAVAMSLVAINKEKNPSLSADVELRTQHQKVKLALNELIKSDPKLAADIRSGLVDDGERKRIFHAVTGRDPSDHEFAVSGKALRHKGIDTAPEGMKITEARFRGNLSFALHGGSLKPHAVQSKPSESPEIAGDAKNPYAALAQKGQTTPRKSAFQLGG